jgi:DNA (cytosine-5)-methyltransferase 1
MGYHRAGFEVVGVDIKPQPHYPFEFHQADALTFPLDGFDAIHASPPCQSYTTMSAQMRGRVASIDALPRLIGPMRERLIESGVPYVIENVDGASKELLTTLRLHGAMFGLPIHRPRQFESNVMVLAPMAQQQTGTVGIYGEGPNGQLFNKRRDGERSIRAPRSLEEARELMGMDWADWRGIKEAIPPAYTEHIGRQVMTHLRAQPA